MKQVPAECKCLLANENPIQAPPTRLASFRRSSSPRPGSPIARKSLLNGRSFQSQQTTPKRFGFESTPINNQQESAPQPTTPPPEENLKANNTFDLVYQALENEDDVFVDKENSGNEEDVEELFLQKVGKSFISPPISPEKPMLELKNDETNRSLKSKNKLAAGRRLEFPLPDVKNTTGRRDFFGIALPESKQAALSEVFTGQIQSAPIPLHNVHNDDDEEDLPPYIFNCDEQSEMKPIIEPIIEKKTSNGERIVPTRNYRSSVSLCLDSNDLKQIENEDCCVTDGDFTEEEDESDQADFGQRFPSFKRRLRKRKTVGTVRNAAAFVLEKRAKELLISANERGDGEHCVPSISI